MISIALALVGWVVPGGAYLALRRYTQFAAFAVLVLATFIGGVMLHGGYRFPQPSELAGLDSVTAMFFKAGAFAQVLAGGPYLVAQSLGGSHTFIEGRLHEYGNALMVLAGIFNVMAVSNAIDSRRTGAR
jgi:hypothetical protein